MIAEEDNRNVDAKTGCGYIKKKVESRAYLSQVRGHAYSRLTIMSIVDPSAMLIANSSSQYCNNNNNNRITVATLLYVFQYVMILRA